MFTKTQGNTWNVVSRAILNPISMEYKLFFENLEVKLQEKEEYVALKKTRAEKKKKK